MHRPFEYQFEWDPVKARLNYRKHKIAFDRAATVFNDPRALSMFDDKHSDAEERWITLGLDQTGMLTIVCHTFLGSPEHRNARVRIISARKATKKEIHQYKGN